MRVVDAAKKDIIKVRRSLSLRSLLKLFKDFHAAPLIPVIDGEERLIGVVYHENLLDLLRPLSAKLFSNIPFTEVDEDVFDLDPVPAMGELLIVDDIMDSNVVSLNSNDSLEEAYRILKLNKKERMPVVDDKGKLIGILGIFDIIWQMFKEKEIV